MRKRNLPKYVILALTGLVFAGCSVGLSSEIPLLDFSVDEVSVEHNHKAPAITATDNSNIPDVLLKFVDCSGTHLGEGTGSVDLMVEWTGPRDVSAECYSGGEKLGKSNVVEVTGLDSPPCQVQSDNTGGCSEDGKGSGVWEVEIENNTDWFTYLTFEDINGDTGEVVFLKMLNQKGHETYELPENASLISQTPQGEEAGRALFSWSTGDMRKTYYLYFTGYIPHHDSYSDQEMCLIINPNTEPN